ncbi:MAG: replicative DNA helicase [Bdellovibrio sp. CG10_big_fil_rev_8_21_14_0_10_47_8]|nr:MAG: replicative DNA helicase [Bdellovibrio sp. CG10_big_fil_rev_8_21_14_0_10_47_8]
MAAKIPPQNIEAEQSILGSLMLEREAWDQIADHIEAADFYKPSHQKIYVAIQELQRKNLPVDLITVSNTLQTKGEIEQIGGSEYLVDLVNRTITSANIFSYAKIVRDKSLLRKVIHQGTQMIEKAYEEDFTDVESFIDQSEADFYKLGETKKTEGLMGAMEVVKSSVIKIEELYKKRSEVTGVATGFTMLDRMTSGMQPGELTIIAARPSMGKTAFSLNLAQHMALRQNKTVAYFSLEMSREAVMMRILASEARINMKDIRSGRIPDNVWPKLIHVAGQVSDSKLFIDESSGISPFEVRARARRLKSQHDIDIIMIDYLQLMDLKMKVESRERAVSEISKSLKSLAKELKIPVVALAQLNRGVEGRADRRPMLSDLRESGSIEQDADVIMLLYRDDYYDKEDPEKQGHAEIIIGKQRNGPTGTVKLKWEAEYGRFRDAEHEPQHPLPPPPSTGPAPSGKPRNFAPGVNQ